MPWAIGSPWPATSNTWGARAATSAGAEAAHRTRASKFSPRRGQHSVTEGGARTPAIRRGSRRRARRGRPRSRSLIAHLPPVAADAMASPRGPGPRLRSGSGAHRDARHRRTRGQRDLDVGGHPGGGGFSPWALCRALALRFATGARGADVERLPRASPRRQRSPDDRRSPGRYHRATGRTAAPGPPRADRLSVGHADRRLAAATSAP